MKRVLAVAVTILVSITLFAMPANAGTLTAASFTANGTGYATTNAVNTRYDWRYTTATSGTVSRIEATVPTGTKPTSPKYLALNGNGGNWAGTPDSVANSMSGTIDVRAKVTLANWATGQVQDIVTKYWSGGNQRSYLFGILGSGQIGFTWSSTGTAGNALASNVNPNFAANSTNWVRATFTPDDGSGNNLTKFYTSTDGTNWSQLGTTIVVAGVATIFDSNIGVQIGQKQDNIESVNGKIYYASVAGSISGTASSPSVCSTTGVVVCFNPADYTSGSTFTSSSPQTEAWTIYRNGASAQPADIAYDLSVAELSGLPAGGNASYRYIDGKAVYVLPSATSIAAGTATLLALSGFTNTSTAGSYSSTITTFDNSAPPIAVDSVTTGTLTFSDLTSSAVVGTTVDPTFSFTVATHSGACNGVAQGAGASSNSTGVSLGRITSATGSVAAQDLSIGTNANTGFNLMLRTAGALTSGSNTIANAPGTNATPAAFPATSTAAFGYTVAGLSRFTGMWAGPETTNRQIATGSTVGTVTNCIAYQVQVTASTPAGTYSTTAIYTAVPSF